MVGVKTTQIMKHFVLTCGGYANVGFVTKDLYNKIDAEWRKLIALGDAKCVIGYLYGKKDSYQMLYYKYSADEEAMDMERPTIVIIDGDKVMKKVIKTVLSYAKQWLFTWHPQRNTASNVDCDEFVAAFGHLIVRKHLKRQGLLIAADSPNGYTDVFTKYNMLNHSWFKIGSLNIRTCLERKKAGKAVITDMNMDVCEEENTDFCLMQEDSNVGNEFTSFLHRGVSCASFDETYFVGSPSQKETLNIVWNREVLKHITIGQITGWGKSISWDYDIRDKLDYIGSMLEWVLPFSAALEDVEEIGEFNWDGLPWQFYFGSCASYQEKGRGALGATVSCVRFGHMILRLLPFNLKFEEEDIFPRMWRWRSSNQVVHRGPSTVVHFRAAIDQLKTSQSKFKCYEEFVRKRPMPHLTLSYCSIRKDRTSVDQSMGSPLKSLDNTIQNAGGKRASDGGSCTSPTLFVLHENRGNV
ncbi:hypothetical protein ACH5RR_003752 [Cinchona calisaya]|uniref:Uncharacterized protein n=1 Tax=Cinchona calisaya TaxID=153742 RepID=A0ABD3AVS8_9GENT